MEAERSDRAPPSLLEPVAPPLCNPIQPDVATNDRVIEETSIAKNSHQHFETDDDEQNVSPIALEDGIAERAIDDAPDGLDTKTKSQHLKFHVSSLDSNAVRGDEPTHVPIRTVYTTNEMCVIASKTLHGNDRASHRDILFGLFLQSTASDLENLAKSAGVSLLRHTKRKSNRGLAFQDEEQDVALRPCKKSKGSPSVLSVIPLALSKPIFLAPSCDQVHSGSGENRIILKRPDLQSLSLLELEGRVLSKFELSTIGKNAIATMNPQYSWFIKQNGTESSRPFVPQKKKRFSTKPIAYNECSMSAFAKWAFSSAGAHKHRGTPKEDTASGYEKPPVAGTDFPSSTALFHFCQVCRRWGHFELECTYLSRSELQPVLSRESTACQALHRLKGTFDGEEKEYSKSSRLPAPSPRGCMVCKSSLPTPPLVCNECASLCHRGCAKTPFERAFLVEWLCPACENNDKISVSDCVVDLESCEGFVIEQTRLPPKLLMSDTLTKSRGVNFTETSWSRVLAIWKGKTPSIAPNPVSKASDATSLSTLGANQVLRVGDFCWAKRQNATMATIGRDEWWPAQVVTVVAKWESSSDGMLLTPYMVKFLAVSRSSRVRATSIIPFFKNLRNVGYTRLSNQQNSQSYVEQRFRIGVQDAISKSGFATIDEALLRADVLSKKEEDSEHQPQQEVATPVIKDGIAVFKHDGFVIRARESARSEVVIGATPHRSRDVALEMKDYAKAFRRTIFPGSLVAWLSMDGTDVHMRVGAVLAANIETKMALVSPIPRWKTMLRPPVSKTGAVVCAYQATASEWIPMDKLHMVNNGPDGRLEGESSQTVVSTLIKNARAKVPAEVK